MSPTRFPKRVVVLVRISKDRENETSTTTQLEKAQAYVASKDGWSIVKVFYEEGISGFDEKASRPGLEGALKMIESKQADVLLVWKLDRMVRSLKRFMKYWSRIEDAGGEFASVVEQFDTTSKLGQLMLVIVAAFAEMESEMKRDRALPWHEKRRELGLPAGGPRPFGYVREDGTLNVLENEAAAIREMAEAILDGRSLASVVKMVNEAGVLGIHGKPMSVHGVKSALTNPTVAGFRRNTDGTLTPGKWQPILDQSTFRDLDRVLSDPRRRTSFNAGKPAHLLTGFATCSVCGVKLVRKNHPAGIRLLCRSCNSSLPMKVADDAVTLWLLDSIDAQAWKMLKEQGRAYDADVVAALEAEKIEIAEMKEAGEIDLAQFRILNRDINARMAAATNDEPLDLPDISSLQTGWEGLDLEGKRTIITTLLDTVQITPHVPGKVEGRDRVLIERAV